MTSGSSGNPESRPWRVAASFTSPQQLLGALKRVKASGDTERRLLVLGPSAFVLLSR